MYTVPNAFKTLVHNLTNVAGSKEIAQLITYVELTLSLATRLGLETEPLTIGWVLLSRMPIHHPLLQRLTPEQRRMRANAALIVPLSSRFGWENALVRYAKAPSEARLYAVQQPMRLDEQMIMFCRQDPCPDPTREDAYETILSATLPFEQRKQKYAEVGKGYSLRIKTAQQEMRFGEVKIEAPMQPDEQDIPWFDAPRPHHVITLTIDDLKPTAQFLDEREKQIGGRIHWCHDLKQIRYRRAITIEGHITLEPEGTQPLHLEGTIHLPGMVSAGKTTLAKLIVAHCIRLGWDVRITLVVGDSHTAIETAHQVNSWFYDDPAGDDVAAVPILGKSQRETHLGRLLASREYAQSLQNGRPHWGERWLMPACPLASRIRWEGDQDVVIPAGSEPCEGLIGKPRSKRGKGERHLCPLFHRCPAKQMYRDMQRAKLWVTTPGALSQAALPLHLDRRVLKVGDLVYEQSDLVILDEVETIVEWYDRTFAQKEALTNGKNGLLDRLDQQIAAYWNGRRVLPPDERRWIIPVRESLKALSGVLTAIADKEQEHVVKQWVKRGYFSPNQLAYRLARRLAGLKEWDSAKILPEERQKHEELTNAAFEPFNELLNYIHDPLRLGNDSPAPPAAELAQLIQAINNLADDVADEGIFSQCYAWILRHYPDIETKLAALRAQLQQSDDPYDQDYLNKQFDRSVDELTQRLQFLLTVALLDRHIHIIVQEWNNKPEMLDAGQPFSRMPRGMRNILPLPLTGQQYGFVNANADYNPEARNRLALFAYTNIGRSYLLNFDHLREDIEGTPGPNVLALSGTSYLPDSTTFHVTLPPAGILLAPDKTEAAIRESRFIWKYFVDERNKPIFISGERDKEQKLRQLMKAMLADGGMPGGFLKKTLDWLKAQGGTNPEQWEDRARVLLLTNSYTQARAAAQILRNGWRDAAETIFNLKQGSGSEDNEIEPERPSTLKRIDIEQFADLGGQVLIAPMQSIGRGFNILNKAAEPKAAFGAVFFLTRPLNPPHDMEAMAQEMNRYALEWAANPGFGAWAADTLYGRALKARECAMELRRLIDHRYSYEHLIENATLGVYPRHDLAATTAGRIVQAVGRLLRGGVPFRAYFIDAAWSPELAKTGDEDRSEPEETSLLTAMINVLMEYVDRDEIGKQLYGSLSEALIATEGRDSN